MEGAIDLIEALAEEVGDVVQGNEGVRIQLKDGLVMFERAVKFRGGIVKHAELDPAGDILGIPGDDRFVLGDSFIGSLVWT